MSRVIIRSAAPEDAPRLREIYAFYVVHTAVTYEYDVPSPEEFRGRMERTLEHYPYLVVVEDGNIRGYAYAGPFHSRAAYTRCCELSIYLDQSARRRGFGRMLYEALEERLRAMGMLNLYACIGDPVEEDEYLTRASEKFHAAMGYTKIGTFHRCGWKFGRWYNMIWMEKLLEEHPAPPAQPDRQKGNGMNSIQDRIRGCMAGGAIGDALGYPVEFMGLKQIFKRYGEPGITAYEPDRETGKAVISDDTQMAMFTADGILVSETLADRDGSAPLPRREVAKAYQDWLVTQDLSFEDYQRRPKEDFRGGASWLLDVPELFAWRAPGNTCLYALRCLKNGGDRIDDYILQKQTDSKGCGGVMRVAPMGLTDRMDIEALDLEGAQLAAITHGHSLGYIPAAVLTHIVHRLVFPGDRPLSLKEAVLEAKETSERLFAGDKYLPAHSALIDLAVELSGNQENDLANIHRLGEGWVADEALAIAVYCALRYQDDFSAGVTAAVNHPGDSDSTGAIAGNILGALHGYEAIGSGWKEGLELLDEILELSDDLYRASLAGGQHPFREMDWIGKYARKND